MSSSSVASTAAGGGPLYTFSLPPSLLQSVNTLPSIINEPLPSPHDIIHNHHHHQQQQQQQQQQQYQQQPTPHTAPPPPSSTRTNESSFSIRFPKPRSAELANSAAKPAQQSQPPSDEEDDDYEQQPDSYSSVGSGPNAPFIWLGSSQATNQYGIHRSLFTLPPLSSSSRAPHQDFPSSHIHSLQVPPITRPRGVSRAYLQQNKHRGGVYALSTRALKSQGVQEAARRLGFRIIEGTGYISGLGKLESSLDEEGEELSSDDEAVVQRNGTDEEVEPAPLPPQHEGPEEDEQESVLTKTSAYSTLTPLQQSLFSSPALKTWTIILLGGGHFAAAVIALNPFFDLSSKLFPNGNPPTPEQLLSIVATSPPSSTDRSIMLLAHKTIHRYTTRRKQGGSQSTQDASGKFAKSAGAQLRRYGEQSLKDEIRETLSQPGWVTLLSQTERVWVRAGARAASGVLWNWPATSGASRSPLDLHREQDSIVSIPIQTRKPTLGECVRVWAELTRVRARNWSAEELNVLEEEVRLEREKGRAAVERRNKAAASAEASRQQQELQQQSKAGAAASIAPVLSDREKAGRDRFGRMVDMVRKGKVEVLVDFLGKYEESLVQVGGGWGPSTSSTTASEGRNTIDTPFPLWWRAHEAGLPLTELIDPALQSESGAHVGEKEGEPVPTSVPSTLLQLAAESGAEEIVQYLLIERRADPTLAILPLYRRRSVAPSTSESSPAASAAAPPPHRTAYDLCPSRPTRDIFRRLMADQPDWYDWAGMGPGGARVPSGLTNEMEEKRDGKQKERRNLLREKARAREAAAASSSQNQQKAAAPSEPVAEVQASTPPPSSNVANRLGGGGGSGPKNTAPSALRQAVDQQAGVTPEMRARIEREKRARAAEARMKGLQQQ
ncbi:hypothetical protein OC846_001372 [Tilletia horrida]|uniref:VLRF1 domain-containing protein n=1 Tax=Tilletia horrida TaxID=155126 RepID=A0AAN6GVH2_9BASI|nr:hypothetical protein OC845_004501 [Tilletia horrida]KAK0556153.1 hypothetical protein OC846_001372 [Tilletia horrida]KAK0569079.1 hypothetical protein OC861_001321 [Tilletia horrida]